MITAQAGVVPAIGTTTTTPEWVKQPVSPDKRSKRVPVTIFTGAGRVVDVADLPAKYRPPVFRSRCSPAPGVSSTCSFW